MLPWGFPPAICIPQIYETEKGPLNTHTAGISLNFHQGSKSDLRVRSKHRCRSAARRPAETCRHAAKATTAWWSVKPQPLYPTNSLIFEIRMCLNCMQVTEPFLKRFATRLLKSEVYAPLSFKRLPPVTIMRSPKFFLVYIPVADSCNAFCFVRDKCSTNSSMEGLMDDDRDRNPVLTDFMAVMMRNILKLLRVQLV